MNSRPKELKYARNKNVLVVGGSGSGKTRFFILPQLLQMHSSYVLTDPKGTLVGSVGKMFNDAGYDVKIFNTVNFKKSMRYNPFVYIHSEKDILKLVKELRELTEYDELELDTLGDRKKILFLERRLSTYTIPVSREGHHGVITKTTVRQVVTS